MDIITNLPRNFTDDEIDAAFMQEIKNGFKLERETEHERVKAAAKQAAHLKDLQELFLIYLKPSS